MRKRDRVRLGLPEKPDWVMLPPPDKRRRPYNVEMQLRSCRCCRRPIVRVWWGEERRWVWVFLVSPDQKLIFNMSPVYDKTAQTMHAPFVLSRMKKHRRETTGAAGVLRQIGPPVEEDQRETEGGAEEW